MFIPVNCQYSPPQLLMNLHSDSDDRRPRASDQTSSTATSGQIGALSHARERACARRSMSGSIGAHCGCTRAPTCSEQRWEGYFCLLVCVLAAREVRTQQQTAHFDSPRGQPGKGKSLPGCISAAISVVREVHSCTMGLMPPPSCAALL